MSLNDGWRMGLQGTWRSVVTERHRCKKNHSDTMEEPGEHDKLRHILMDPICENTGDAVVELHSDTPSTD